MNCRLKRDIAVIVIYNGWRASGTSLDGKEPQERPGQITNGPEYTSSGYKCLMHSDGREYLFYKRYSRYILLFLFYLFLILSPLLCCGRCIYCFCLPPFQPLQLFLLYAVHAFSRFIVSAFDVYSVSYALLLSLSRSLSVVLFCPSLFIFHSSARIRDIFERKEYIAQSIRHITDNNTNNNNI